MTSASGTVNKSFAAFTNCEFSAQFMQLEQGVTLSKRSLEYVHNELCDADVDLAAFQTNDGIVRAACRPLNCLRSDIEDSIEGSMGPMVWWHPEQDTGAAIAQRWVQFSSRELPLAKTLEAVVCVDGPLSRVDMNQRVLHRMALALNGMGSKTRVVAIVAVKDAVDCKKGRHFYALAFASKLAKFVCTVDKPDGSVVSDFLSRAKNATWWREHQWELGDRTSYNHLQRHLLNMQMKSYCLDAVEGLESARMDRFDWVVYLRNDFDFLEQHPPLSAFAKIGGVWVPRGLDFRGLCDMWAVIERKHADAYLERYRAWLDGSAIPWVEQFTKHTYHILPERMLMLQLYRHGIWPKLVHRFVPTAALRCNCSRAEIVSSKCCYCDHLQYSQVRNVAKRLQLHGWRWQLQASKRADMSIECCGGGWARWQHNITLPRLLYGCAKLCSAGWVLSITAPSSGTALPSCYKLYMENRNETDTICF